MRARDNALIILAKYPKQGEVKTRLIPALGEIAASYISELFLVDLLRRFTAHGQFDLVIAGAKTDSKEVFRNLLAKYLILSEDIEIIIPGTGTIEGDIIGAYSHVLERHPRAILTPADIPYISVKMVEDLFQALDVVDFVFHPNIDGDVCPHGIRISPQIFRGSTRAPSWLPHLFSRIKSERISYKIFSPIFDIDRFEDLFMFYNWQIFLEDSGERECYCPETMKYLKSLTLS